MKKYSLEKAINYAGFSLVELIFAMAMVVVMLSIAFPSYHSHVREAKLKEVQGALLENARFLERHYQNHGSFKQNSTTWPILPITSTDDFCIRLNGVARGALDGKFTLKAVAKNKKDESRVMRVNESLNTVICEDSGSTCEDKNNYFTDNDKKCQVY